MTLTGFQLDEIRKVRAPVDAWWVVFVTDPIADLALVQLTKYFPNVTANSITFASLFFGLLSAACFATGNGLVLIVGACVYQISFILDCMDGKVARLSKSASLFGQFLDSLVNNLVDIFNIAALTWGLKANTSILVMGMALLGFHSLQNFLTQYIDKPEDGTWSPFVPDSESWLRRHRLLAPMTGPDRNAILLTLAPITGLFIPGFVIVLLAQIGIVIAKLRKILTAN